MKRIVSLSLLALALGCAGEDVGASLTTPPPSSGTRGVTQGGAQDIAVFRAAVARGEVPSSSSLEPTGFFAEHALDLPPATCGQSVCLNPMLAVAPRFDGGNWTMAFVALSTAVDPSQRMRPPLHLVLVLEDSVHLRDGAGSVASSLRAMLASLPAGDRVSVVLAGERARVTARGATPTEAAAGLSVNQVDDRVALYDGLAEAATLTRSLEGFTGQHRVLLLTSGRATAGVTDPARIAAAGESLVSAGASLSVVGFGAGFVRDVVAPLGDIGAGTFAYATSGSDLRDVLRAEAETTLFPLATGFRLELRAAPGYRVGRVYGARRARVSGGVAVLESPALFVGTRMGSRDVGGGRRGGGGGLFVELVADASMRGAVGAGAPAFTVRAVYRDADAGRDATTDGSAVNPLAPGENPGTMWPVFSDEARGKVFMMLNMYLALSGAVQFYEQGDCARGQGLIDMMQPASDAWLRRFPDPDLQADDDLMTRLRENMLPRCRTVTPVQPRTFSGGCFFI